MSHKRYLPFPSSNRNDNETKPKQSQKKNGSHIYTKTLQSAQKQTGIPKANGSQNQIKYNIEQNKSKSKFNAIIEDKLSKRPSIQQQNKKSPLAASVHKQSNKPPTNPDEKWMCSMCTYKNLSIMAYCEVCGTKKPNDRHNNNNNNNSVVDEDGDLLSLNLDMTQQNEVEHCFNYKRSHSKDEEIAKQLQEELNRHSELHKVKKRQKELEDEYLAKKIQAEIQEQQRKIQHKKSVEDELMAQTLQKEHEEELFKYEQQKLHNERAAIEFQAKEDMEYAKYFDQKQKDDEERIRDDESFALKMCQELNKGAAWFCNGCFAMNMDIKQFECSVCDTVRPKPSIPKYIMSLRDDLSTHILNTIRECPESIVNITFVQNFVVKYFKMCEEIGNVLSYPKIVYHWTRSNNFDPIAKTGLQVPDGVDIQHQTDTGFYGKGVYTSPDPKYAQGYGHGANKLFVCLSLPGRQYRASYPACLGKPLQDGYDSHVSDDRNEMEWVFFDADQLLLCYLVTLDFLEAKAKTQMDYVCQFLESKFLGMREEKLNKLTKHDV